MAEAFGIACHELVSLDFRCGSESEVSGDPQEGLHLGVKQTESMGKRTFLLKCLLSGVDRT